MGNFIVVLIVILAVIYIYKTFLKSLKNKTSCNCKGCSCDSKILIEKK